jgi:hypothetical protein
LVTVFFQIFWKNLENGAGESKDDILRGWIFGLKMGFGGVGNVFHRVKKYNKGVSSLPKGVR